MARRRTGTGTRQRPRRAAGAADAGPGSLAPLGRRVVALVIDWVACLAISGAFFASVPDAFLLSRGNPLATLGIFALENVLLVGSIGHTLGHRLVGPAGASRVPGAEAGRRGVGDDGARVPQRAGPHRPAVPRGPGRRLGLGRARDCTTGWPGRRSSAADRSGGRLPDQAVPPVEAPAPPHAGQDRPRGRPHLAVAVLRVPHGRAVLPVPAGTVGHLRGRHGSQAERRVRRACATRASPTTTRWPPGETRLAQRRSPSSRSRWCSVAKHVTRSNCSPCGTSRTSPTRYRSPSSACASDRARATWSGSRSRPVTRATPAARSSRVSSPSPHPTSSALDAPPASRRASRW